MLHYGESRSRLKVEPPPCGRNARECFLLGNWGNAIMPDGTTIIMIGVVVIGIVVARHFAVFARMKRARYRGEPTDYVPA